jgi:cellulose biosynthesis protein BcsQ
MIISVINNKGGVGKSTITQNLAHALANKGKKVLVIDQDPQSNTTSVLLPPTNSNTLFNFYKDEIPILGCIYPTPYEGIDILPNSNKTDTIEVSLYADVRQSYFLLRDNLREHVLSAYDIALIDCPPNLGLFVMMALICSDSAIVPIEAGSRYSVDGFVSAFEAIEGAAGAVQHPLKFLRAVINKVDLRATIHKSSVDYLRRVYGEKIFQTTIPTNTDIQKAEMERETVLRYAPHCNGAKRFKALADELLEIVNG